MNIYVCICMYARVPYICVCMYVSSNYYMCVHTLYCRSPSFFLSLEHAILHGQPVMMHHVDTMRFDPSLITLLDCNYTSSAGQLK